jgi:glycosyltransferase involved in cell wall biosynthesis
LTRVSICIPTRNRSRLIGAAIESALSQSECDIEVIVIDDASTDDTLDVLAQYSDPRFRVERNARRLGLGGNLNRCLEIAQGEYVKILCDDDVLYAGVVAQLAGGLDRFPQATFATSAFDWINAEGAPLKTTRLVKQAPAEGALFDLHWIAATSSLWRNRIGSPSQVLLRKAALEGVRFDERYPHMMDWEVWLRLLTRGPLVYVPHIGTAIRIHECSLSARNGPLAQSASDLLNLATVWRTSRSEFRGAISRFALKRLQLLCLLRAAQIAAANAFRRDRRSLAVNLGVVRRALQSLFSR